jgi:hypothetical protein
MKVDYDSEAKALLFEFGELRVSEEGDYVEELADGMCIVRFHNDRPEAIELDGADKYLTALDEAAERFELDAESLRAAAQAAFAAPDREIIIDVGRRLPNSDEEELAAAKAA